MPHVTIPLTAILRTLTGYDPEREREQRFRDAFNQYAGGPPITPVSEEAYRQGGMQESPATRASGFAPPLLPSMPPVPPTEGGFQGMLHRALGGPEDYGKEDVLALESLKEAWRRQYETSQQGAVYNREAALAWLKNSFPPSAKEVAQTGSYNAAADLSRTRQGQVGKAPAMNPLQQSEYDFEQQYGYKRPTGPGTGGKGVPTLAQINASAQKLTGMALDKLSQGELDTALAGHNALVQRYNAANPGQPVSELAAEDLKGSWFPWTSARKGVTQKTAGQDPAKMTNEELLKALGQ